MKRNRIMIAAPSSGSGKTTVTCGLLHLLKKKGLHPVSMKCGPDFIDPMFHTKVIDVPGRNLDTFFTSPSLTRALLAKNSKASDLVVLEGVMGYYDGLGFENSRAGSSDLAEATKTPVILVVPARGMSRSVLPLIRGFLDYDKTSCIRGILLNRVSSMVYPRMKAMIEREIGIPVLGYLPVMDDLHLESRHLGLVLPHEIKDLQSGLDRLAEQMEESIDLVKILELAAAAPELRADRLSLRQRILPDAPIRHTDGSNIRVGVAEDEAFCFIYRDNLDLLKEMGAEILPFSPLHDSHLPDGLDAMILSGGYPEIYGAELSGNTTMRSEIRSAVHAGLPTIAECGGFLYLHRSIIDPEGVEHPAVGIFPETCRFTGRLSRFGYVTLKENRFFGADVGDIKAHEFHYYESGDPGDAFLAVKPTGNRSWRCGYSTDTLYAGFPHLYYYANPAAAEAFLRAAARKR